MISANNLSKTYRDGDQIVTAVQSCDVEIAKGEKVALLGSSGSGKTTLLNLLSGLDRPSSGQLTVADMDLHELNSRQLANFRRDKIGVVFQSFELIDQKTALQNVELPLMLAGVPFQKRRHQARAALEQVGLEHRIGHRPYQLSGGEKQRVAVARAMIAQPSILLADEPTGNLDSASTHKVMQLIIQLVKDCGSTLLLITHDRGLAEQYTDRILVMSDGKITEDTAT